MSNLLFRKKSKPRSANPHAGLKAGFLLLSIGFFLQFLFLNLLSLILGIGTEFAEMTILISGLPELDIVLPFLVLILLPMTAITTNLWVTLLSVIPWIIAGCITGYFCGPDLEKAIFLSFPSFFGSIAVLIILALFTLFGVLLPVFPSLQIVFLFATILTLAMYGMVLIGGISLYFFLPSYIGYYIGKKYTPQLYPQIFYAQPNRIDPRSVYCRFLTRDNRCGVGRSSFIPGTCDNRFNQVTCPIYVRVTKATRKKIQPGGLFSEIKKSL